MIGGAFIHEIRTSTKIFGDAAIYIEIDQFRILQIADLSGIYRKL